ncbi:hypothetical protein NPIL_298011 [Nephila pilipes]|uniref:Uncharacterized protein n=1 Tax=Nephila pilipes TaxID=299642 RepID=A0A8X6IUJ5_NEPPI|nr:hypothetical protein NPIL_298011 [Nephila pilipes]
MQPERSGVEVQTIEWNRLSRAPKRAGIRNSESRLPRLHFSKETLRSANNLSKKRAKRQRRILRRCFEVILLLIQNVHPQMCSSGKRNMWHGNTWPHVAIGVCNFLDKRRVTVIAHSHTHLIRHLYTSCSLAFRWY